MTMFPLWSSHHQLASFLSHVQRGDTAAAHAAADWLQERDATVADVTLWYAHPPSWLRQTHEEDEAAREVFWRWLRCVEPEQPAMTTAKLRKGPMPSSWIHWEWVRQAKLDHAAIADDTGPLASARGIAEIANWASEPYYAFARTAIERGRKEQKRAILAAFADVVLERRLAVDVRELQQAHHWTDLLRMDLLAAGFPDHRDFLTWAMIDCFRLGPNPWQGPFGCSCSHDKDRGEIVFRQRLAAPDWIPPEPALLRS